MKNKIIIISGDPNSINSELIFKVWKKINKNLKKRIYIISNFNLIKSQFKKLNFNYKIIKKSGDLDDESDKLKIINIDLKFKNPFSVSRLESSKFVRKSLDIAHDYSLNNQYVQGIINCPLNKKLLNKKKIGVTEYLASKCGLKNSSEVMLIKSKKLAVSPITTHIDVKEVNKKINKNLIRKKIETINFWYKKFLKKKPKIGILGLNPHNAELRKSSEEKKIIIPTIKKLKKKKINVHGPLVSDTIFINDYKNFDVIVGMYHDQVLSPFKAIFKFDAINITLGLKYFRVSPDHGTATNIINKNKGDETSLLKCIEFISKLKK